MRLHIHPELFMRLTLHRKYIGEITIPWFPQEEPAICFLNDSCTRHIIRARPEFLETLAESDFHKFDDWMMSSYDTGTGLGRSVARTNFLFGFSSERDAIFAKLLS
jgi:hypothetical protein